MGVNQGWIGVDLDGTLARYEGWKGEDHVGEPVPEMLRRVKQWVASGREVRIFTARVSVDEPARSRVVRSIQAWCKKNGLPALPVTNTKDFAMSELWDDRAVAVEHNTGRSKGWR